MITEGQLPGIKKKLIEEVEKTFPADKKQEITAQIQAMDATQVEQVLAQNQQFQAEGGKSAQKCIFCSIVSGEIPTNRLDENKKAIATLEINPISKGHSLIIPREHIDSPEKMPKEAKELAEKVSTIIKEKLKPKEIEIIEGNLFGHEIINILPIYDKETINSERKPAKPEELEELKALLEVKIKKKAIQKPKIKRLTSKKLWLPKRIP